MLSRGAALGLLTAAAALALLCSAPAHGATPVLGKRGLMPYGKGWGFAHPRTIFNGGVPSGMMNDIRWTGWGSPTARGRGVKSTYRPQGGYYARQVPVQLKASRLGRCPGSTRRAYTRLVYRAHDRPGGSYGDWRPWTLDLCDWPAEPPACEPLVFEESPTAGASEITAWDTSCAQAQSLALASKAVAFKPGFARYRLETQGYVCSGYSFDDDAPPAITWNCARDTAVVEFKRT